MENTTQQTPTERLASQPLCSPAISDEECEFCGRKLDVDGHLCSRCFDERWEFKTDAEADEHARIMRLTLRQECIRCGDRIDDPRYALGATTCADCKPHTAAA